ncbi:MAG: fumarylacetoacetase [Phycisphaerales bacterium]|nr:fumarylacetoacetase [Phycisphaerae bacterium]NNF41848.1 fumarylacetoacetase [Phycisphaerales bacterium]NNM24595.1 fumarylacetoacetase [Phycisphaerales bacterium]
MLDETHAPDRRSWVESANDPGSDFPIQNLPFGVFRRRGSDEPPRIGVAIGDAIADVRVLVEQRHLDAAGPAGGCALCGESLNAFMTQGPEVWNTTRRAVATLLDADEPALRDNASLRTQAIVAQRDAEMCLPAVIGDYTDFYCSIHHATNVGSMFRPDNPLMPNYKHLPVGYHGRASSIVTSPTPVRRPFGQTIAADADTPAFGPCRLLDYEMEMGFFVGPGNPLGTRIPLAAARSHIFGMVIVNDWSARDVQKWEYQPLGPFNAKNFLTSISPWVVTLAALEPYRVDGLARGADDPPVLDYLRPTEPAGFDVTVEVLIASAAMRDKGLDPVRVSTGNFQDMYWSITQMLTHHTSTGCNLRPGDLLASGTISGPTEDARGCLLERTWRGQHPIALPDGTERKFLQDGDEVIMRAAATGAGARIGFGECRGIVMPAE